MKMNINLSNATKTITKSKDLFMQYASLIFIISVLSIYGFLVWQIGVISKQEPTEAQIAEQLKTTQRPKINQATLDKVQQLQDQNVAVQSLFKAARDNPFQE